jgi:hypothetical protein
LELQQHGVLWGRKLRRGTMYLGSDAGITLWFDLKVSLNSTSCCHYSCVSVAHIPTFLLLLKFSSTIYNRMLSILSKVRNELMLKSKFFKGFLVLLYKHQTHDSSYILLNSLEVDENYDTTFNRSSYHNRVCTLLFSLGLIPIPNKLNSNPSVSSRFMSLSHWNIKHRLNWKWVIQGTLVKQKKLYPHDII